jgi:biotin carboxylase
MLIDKLGLPLVIKPRNESNNRGVHIMHNRDDLLSLINDLQPRLALMEAEQFITGTLYHCNIITYDNDNYVVQVGEYINNPVDLS